MIVIDKFKLLDNSFNSEKNNEAPNIFNLLFYLHLHRKVFRAAFISSLVFIQPKWNQRSPEMLSIQPGFKNRNNSWLKLIHLKVIYPYRDILSGRLITICSLDPFHS